MACLCLFNTISTRRLNFSTRFLLPRVVVISGFLTGVELLSLTILLQSLTLAKTFIVQISSILSSMNVRNRIRIFVFLRCIWKVPWLPIAGWRKQHPSHYLLTGWVTAEFWLTTYLLSHWLSIYCWFLTIVHLSWQISASIFSCDNMSNYLKSSQDGSCALSLSIQMALIKGTFGQCKGIQDSYGYQLFCVLLQFLGRLPWQTCQWQLKFCFYCKLVSKDWRFWKSSLGLISDARTCETILVPGHFCPSMKMWLLRWIRKKHSMLDLVNGCLSLWILLLDQNGRSLVVLSVKLIRVHGSFSSWENLVIRISSMKL